MVVRAASLFSIKTDLKQIFILHLYIFKVYTLKVFITVEL